MNDVPTVPQLLLHPVRMRIVVAYAGSGEMTALQLGARLPDVPMATLYRQLRTLTEAGILSVVAERQVRGAVERTFALQADRALVAPADVASASPDELMRAFTTFVATLLAEYAAFARRPDRTPGDAAYFVTPLNLTDDEFAAFGAEFQAVLMRAMATSPSASSRRRTVATIVIPNSPAQGDRS
jgi:DNA-binding transcriptional ArsR family regulator